MAITNPSNVKLSQSSSPTTAVNNQLESKLMDEPPDVLSATNLEQWKSLIKDLKQDRMARRHWTTERFRAGMPPVLLKYNAQSIIYKTACVDVSVVPDTTDFLEAEIFSPKMNIEETRELGLKLCNMFGFDSNKFLAWLLNGSKNVTDAQNFSETDPVHLHFLKVRHSYNDQQPWYIILCTSEESAVSKLMGKSSH